MMVELFNKNDTLDYKTWAIKTRIKRLEVLIRLFPDSEYTPERQTELKHLKMDLDGKE